MTALWVQVQGQSKKELDCGTGEATGIRNSLYIVKEWTKREGEREDEGGFLLIILRVLVIPEKIFTY